MKKTLATTLLFLLALTAAAVGTMVVARSQDTQRKRVPTLTTDDLKTSGDVAREIPGGAGETRQPGTRSQAASGELRWQRSMSQALDLASSGNKVVVVDVYTDWCGWCKKMDKDIYSDPKIAAMSDEAVFLKLNAEDRSEGSSFARQAGVTGFPTTIILSPDGKRIGGATGYIASVDTFIGMIRRARQ